MTGVEQIKKREVKVRRPGKTAKDKKSGAWERRFVNASKRVEWQKANTKSAAMRHNASFPREACNGKKNRYRVTGAEGKSVIVG